MKKYLTYRKDGTVIMVSDKKIQTDLEQKQFTIDENKENENWNRKIENNKLIYEKSAQIIKDEKKQMIEDKKIAITNAKTLDEVKQIQKEIIDLIYANATR